MEIINEAEVWFIDNGILPSTITYNIYNQSNLLMNSQATAIIGIGDNRSGKSIGFAIEVMQGHGVVAGGIIEPYGIATYAKKGVMYAKQYNKPLIEIMQLMAKQHRDKIEKHLSEQKTEQSFQAVSQTQEYPQTQPIHQEIQPPQKTTANLKSKNTEQQDVRDSEKPKDFWWFLKNLVIAFVVVIAVTMIAVLKFGINVKTIEDFYIMVLGLFAMISLVLAIWYAVKSVYATYQYSTLWAIIAISAFFFGFFPIALGIFYFTFNLEDEDKQIFKRFFATAGVLILFGIGFAVVIPALNDHQKRIDSKNQSTSKPWEQYQQKQTNAKIDELMKNAPPFDPNTAKPIEQTQANAQPTQQQLNEQFLSKYTGTEREHYEKILSVHPDAMQIAQSQDFANWKASLQGELKSKVENTLQSGEAEKVNIVLRWYKEDRGMIPKQN